MTTVMERVTTVMDRAATGVVFVEINTEGRNVRVFPPENLELVGVSDRLRIYAEAFTLTFQPYTGPDEPLGFEPEDYPVR